MEGSSYKPNSLYRAARFANFEGILGFSVPSVILADLLGNASLLVIGAFRSTLLICFRVSRFTACDHPVTSLVNYRQ